MRDKVNPDDRRDSAEKNRQTYQGTEKDGKWTGGRVQDDASRKVDEKNDRRGRFIEGIRPGMRDDQDRTRE